MKTRTRKPLESEIQKNAMALLKHLGWRVYRRNVMAMGGEHKGKRWFVRAGEKGMSDLWAMLPTGLHAEIEIKRPGNWPTADQLAWLRSMNGVGGSVAFWVDNTRDLELVAHHVMAGGRIEFVGDEGQYRLIPAKD